MPNFIVEKELNDVIQKMITTAEIIKRDYEKIVRGYLNNDSESTLMVDIGQFTKKLDTIKDILEGKKEV